MSHKMAGFNGNINLFAFFFAHGASTWSQKNALLILIPYTQLYLLMDLSLEFIIYLI